MSKINKEMEDLEEDIKLIKVGDEYKTVEEVLDSIIGKDKKKRIMSTG